MNLYCRLILRLIISFLKPRQKVVTAPIICKFHVLPNDLDLNMHMNNGRYLTIMDLGRLELTIRTGLLKLMFARKHTPVVGGIKIRYRIALQPFQPYQLETKVVCWDEKWIYIEQRFIILKGKKAGVVAAIALVKAGFYDQTNKCTVPTASLIEKIGSTTDSPPMPEHISRWIIAEEALRKLTAQAS